MSIYTLYWIRYDTMTDPLVDGYIGITKQTLKSRHKQHRNRTKNIPKDAHIESLHNGTKEEMLALEETYRPTPNIGWNMAKGGDHHGPRHSDDTKRKLSESLSGRTLTEEHRKKLGESKKGEKNPMYGKPLGVDHKEKISNSLKGKTKGRKHTEETKQKMSKSTLGMTHSEETKQKMSKARTGSKNHFYGKKHSEETRRKMREAHQRRKEKA